MSDRVGAPPRLRGGQSYDSGHKGGEPDRSERVALSAIGGHQLNRLRFEHSEIELAKHVVDEILKQTA